VSVYGRQGVRRRVGCSKNACQEGETVLVGEGGCQAGRLHAVENTGNGQAGGGVVRPPGAGVVGAWAEVRGYKVRREVPCHGGGGSGEVVYGVGRYVWWAKL